MTDGYYVENHRFMMPNTGIDNKLQGSGTDDRMEQISRMIGGLTPTEKQRFQECGIQNLSDLSCLAFSDLQELLPERQCMVKRRRLHLIIEYLRQLELTEQKRHLLPDYMTMDAVMEAVYRMENRRLLQKTELNVHPCQILAIILLIFVIHFIFTLAFNTVQV